MGSINVRSEHISKAAFGNRLPANRYDLAFVQGKMKTTSRIDPVEFIEKRKAEKSG